MYIKSDDLFIKIQKRGLTPRERCPETFNLLLVNGSKLCYMHQKTVKAKIYL